MFERRDRVVELLKREISSLLRTLKNPKLAKILTVTDLELSRDMKKARVFYSIIGTEEEKETTAKILERSVPFLYRQLKGRLSMKFIPFLEFEYDETPARAHRIEQILDHIQKEDSGKPRTP